MPIGLEEWRAGVGSNNAARSHALGKLMRRKCPRNFLSQLISYLVALFTEGTWFASDYGELHGNLNVLVQISTLSLLSRVYNMRGRVSYSLYYSAVEYMTFGSIVVCTNCVYE